MSNTVRGRLAPSPTGYLHLGNAWAFLFAWLACRSRQGTLVLRIEDIDPDRSKNIYFKAILEDLQWLGLHWDEGPDKGGSVGPYIQSQRMKFYGEALARLSSWVYPCYCTRKELRTLAGAPHPGEAGAPYPGTCRSLTLAERHVLEAAGRRPCLRLRCAEEQVVFTDGLHGVQALTLAQCGGDFALQRSDGIIAYQLAVAVDDGNMGISQVVRGEDLLSSTPRQLILLRLLGFPIPQFIHVPLLCDAEGERLAKRHASLTLRSLREAGLSPEAVCGYLGWKAGLIPGLRPMSPAGLLEHFHVEILRRADIERRIRIEPDVQRLLSTIY